MHELSIAMSIAEIVEEESRLANSIKVEKITIEIGTQSGVMLDALQFAMDEVILHSSFKDALVIYEIITASASCEECCHEFDIQDFFMVCPVCNSSKTFLIKGKELKIKSIEIKSNN